MAQGLGGPADVSKRDFVIGVVFVAVLVVVAIIVLALTLSGSTSVKA